jgi:hypothetical protein
VNCIIVHTLYDDHKKNISMAHTQDDDWNFLYFLVRERKRKKRQWFSPCSFLFIKIYTICEWCAERVAEISWKIFQKDNFGNEISELAKELLKLYKRSIFYVTKICTWFDLINSEKFFVLSITFRIQILLKFILKKFSFCK